MAYKTYKREHYMRPAWRLMINRCHKPNSPDYFRYGARGIKVCRRWHDFDNFLKDMGERPDGMTIERINNDKDYKPSNCRWVTRVEQADNRRTKRLITHKKVTLSLKEWSNFTGIKRSTLGMRIDSYKWSVEKALTYGARRTI